MSKTDKTDAVWQRAEIESPCINICVIHPETQLCTGCMRSLEEIGAWSKLSSQARKAVMDDIPNRGALLKKRRGGRVARLKR